MNTARKRSRVYQCTRCPNTFMMVGSVPIGMAFPRKVQSCLHCANRSYHPHILEGVCPDHRSPIGGS